MGRRRAGVSGNDDLVARGECAFGRARSTHVCVGHDLPIRCSQVHIGRLSVGNEESCRRIGDSRIEHAARSKKVKVGFCEAIETRLWVEIDAILGLRLLSTGTNPTHK